MITIYLFKIGSVNKWQTGGKKLNFKLFYSQ